MNLFLKSLVVFMCLSTGVFTASEEFDAEYVELGELGKPYIFTTTNDGGENVVYLNHTGAEYLECPNRPDYKCFLSNVFSLVVHLDSTMEQWEYFDLSFQRERLGDIRLLGWGFEAVQKIQSKQSGMDYTFFINSKQGLFMFTVLDSQSGEQNVYLSRSECGIDILSGCEKDKQ